MVGRELNYKGKNEVYNSDVGLVILFYLEIERNILDIYLYFVYCYRRWVVLCVFIDRF